MIFKINDKRGEPWAYDIEGMRFYLNDPCVEQELGERNGFIAKWQNLDVLMCSLDSVAEFDPYEAFKFCRSIELYLDWLLEFKNREYDMRFYYVILSSWEILCP